MSEVVENNTGLKDPILNKEQQEEQYEEQPKPVIPDYKETPSFNTKPAEELLHELSNDAPNFTLENSQIQNIPTTSQPDQEEFSIASKLVLTEMLQETKTKTPTKISERPTSVTPASQKKRDVSPNSNNQKSQMVLSRLYTVKSSVSRTLTPEKSTRSVSPMSSYINKRVQDRSFELKLQTAEENRQAQLQAQAKGKMILSSLTQRREIEKQVDALENRIKRLKTEEQLAQKKVEQANEKARRMLASKMRHQEDLAAKNLLNKQREEMVQKRRQELVREKEEAREKAKKAIIERWREKFESAYAVKKASEDYDNIAKAKRSQEEEKKKVLSKKVNGWEKLSKKHKHNQHETSVKKLNEKYIEKAKEEKEKAQELTQRFKSLEEVEKELIAKISVTRRLYADKMAELENLR